MTEGEEARLVTASRILGMAQAIDLLLDGVKANIHPQCVTDEQERRLRRVFAALKVAAAELSDVAREVQGG